tara:strand:+ start:587 stop:841 length:255 start_codon:yes stop_codon:yes gene_type:complete
MVTIDPQKYNLSNRIKLQEGPEGIFIIINRKSRVVMKDAERILEIVKKIKNVDSKKNVGILSLAPICSKTKIFLLNKKISIKKT